MTATRSRWLDRVNLALGAWLLVMPFFGLMPLDSPAAINGYLFGVIIAGVSVAALVREKAWEEWSSFAIGLWLMFAPFVLDFASGDLVMWNSIVIGLFIAGDTLWRVAFSPRESGGHHPSHA